MGKIDINKKKKLNQAINLIEDLSWILDSKKNIDLKTVPILLRELIESNSNISIYSKYESKNSNKNYLIGVLPNLFIDEDIFNTNNDLIVFATEVLKIPISKAAKRSRFEYIGLIVCEVVKLNDSNLTSLVSALSELTGNIDRLKQFKEAKKNPNFSWNEAIQQLSHL